MDQTQSQSPFQSQTPLEPQQQVQPQPQSQAQPQSPLYATAPLPQEKAPTLLLVISTLIIIFASLSIVVSLFLLVISPMLEVFTPAESFLSSNPFVLTLIISVVYLVIALGFRRLKRWSLYAYTTLGALSFLAAGYSLTYGEGINLISVVIQLLIVFYLWSIQAKFNK